MSFGKSEKGAIFLVVIFLIIIVTAGILIVSLQKNPIDEVLETDQILKVLFVITDEKDVVTANTLFYYPVSKKAALFSIPNDTGAIYSSIGRVAALDVVYLEKGSEAFHKEIEKILGITIPFRVEIDLKKFSVLADFLGGFSVFIPTPVDVVFEEERFLLPSGSITLDGDKLITYLKYKTDFDSREDVNQRKDNVILSFLISLNNNARLFTKEKSFNHIYSLINVNLDKKDALSLFQEIALADGERLSPQTITGRFREVDGNNLLFPFYDGQLIKDVVKQSMGALIASSDTSFTRTYVLEIQNGTSVQGLARNTSVLLKNVGYDILGSVNADSDDYEKTLIIDHIGNMEVAKSLGDFIHCTNIVTEEINDNADVSDVDNLVDFTIILGKDFDGRYVR